ncbi:3'-5' exonuclease [Nocardia sp. NPDC051787]|uniref:3'-5' exonuclease n=1 Tax=Nocardia sp. NPDC051787 TaxID=3155415 RepID=UPI00343327F4
MNDNPRLLNVVDVEATCWDGPAPVGSVSEIIEIGLTVVDLDSCARIAKHRILVRPDRSTVSEFCTELTGLTQAEVDTGIEFADACRLLASEHQAGLRPWASWGDYDRKQFEWQCAAADVEYPFGKRHTNAKQVFSESYGSNRRQGMASALRIAELPLEGRHHRGADDAWNIAALVLDLIGRNSWRITSGG